jgi:stage V sporulation protein AA
MNFHADVSMPLVHQRVYYLLTGKVEKNPLVLQIPYSIGVGMGLLVFFNHAFKRKFNEEPSPLEVEMFLYQQNINKCMVWNKEEQESEKESSKKAGEQNA